MENKKKKNGNKKHAYETYFQDYEEVVLPDGKSKWMYVGKYYVTGLSLPRQILMRVFYGIAWLVSVGLFLAGASSQMGGNSIWYVTLPQALTVPFLFLTGWSFFSYFPAVPRIKEWDYLRSIRYFRRIVQIAAIGMGCSTAAQIIYLLLHWKEKSSSAVKGLVFFFVASVLLYMIYGCESKVEYRLEDQELQ